MAEQNHEVEEGGHAGSQVGIVEDCGDEETVAQHDQSVETEVEEEDGPISERQDVAHLQ